MRILGAMAYPVDEISNNDIYKLYEFQMIFVKFISKKRFLTI